MPYLLCNHSDKHTEWTAVLDEDSFTLGYSDTASVPLPDPALASREARIFRVGDRYQLKDLAEKDRVLHNGALVREAILKDGDRLQIGRILVRFLEDVPREEGQVVLRPGRLVAETARERAGSFPVPFEPEAGSAPSVRPPAGSDLGVPFLLIVGLAAIAGIIIGMQIVKTEPRRSPAAGRSVSDAAGAAPAAAPAATQADPVEALRSQLEGPRSGASDSAGPVPAVEPGARASAPPAVVPPAVVPPAPADSLASRRRLFRIYLDAAGRPPTRDEERTVLPLPVAEQLQRACAASMSRPEWVASARDASLALLGRAPSEADVRRLAQLAGPGKPPAYWIVTGDEYASEGFRRPRSASQRAASLLVDLLDSPPASSTELDVVEKALEAGGGASAAEVIRTLASSPKSFLQTARGKSPGAQDDISWWKDDLFRFLLRAPTKREEEAIPGILAGMAPGKRRSWFLMALASRPEYGTY